VVIEDGVVHSHAFWKVLLVGTAGGEGGGHGPGTDLDEGQVLEDEAHLWIAGGETAEGLVRLPARRTLEIRVFKR
jgi:hypothetical protein